METRTFTRKHLIYHLRVFNAKNGNMLGHMTNIDANGLMLISENPIEVGTVFELEMHLPKNLMANQVLHFNAESKWCRKDDEEGFYSMGFRIIEIAQDQLAVVANLTEYFFQENFEDNPQDDMNPALQ